MKKEGKYRFSLQFSAETEEQQAAGELLEKMGNRKSAIVVAAINEYILSHPELKTPNSKIEVKITAGLTKTEIEQMLQIIVERRLASLQIVETEHGGNDEPSDVSARDIEEMLDNLDLF